VTARRSGEGRIARRSSGCGACDPASGSPRNAPTSGRGGLFRIRTRRSTSNRSSLATRFLHRVTLSVAPAYREPGRSVAYDPCAAGASRRCAHQAFPFAKEIRESVYAVDCSAGRCASSAANPFRERPNRKAVAEKNAEVKSLRSPAWRRATRDRCSRASGLPFVKQAEHSDPVHTSPALRADEAIAGAALAPYAGSKNFGRIARTSAGNTVSDAALETAMASATRVPSRM
jgi:hypothetical protein